MRNSNSNTGRFGPAAKREGNLTEVRKKMDWSPVWGHYDNTSCHVRIVSPDGRSWRVSWTKTFYDEDTSVVANRALGSFVDVGAVAACKVAADDAVDYYLGKGGVSRHKLEYSLKKICKEGAYWGVAAGAFETFEFAAQLMRGRSDWKNTMIGGALAGATVSAAASYSSHRGNVDMRQVIKTAIAGGAIGTAFEFVSHRRHADRFDQPHQLRTGDATDQTLELTDEPANPLSRTS